MTVLGFAIATVLLSIGWEHLSNSMKINQFAGEARRSVEKGAIPFLVGAILFYLCASVILSAK
jgi:hypothetical protein